MRFTRTCVRAALLAALVAAGAACSESSTSASDSTAGADEGDRSKPLRAAAADLLGPPVQGTAAGVQFEAPEIDFGVLGPGSVATGETALCNTGSEPRRIAQVIASCGCTAADEDLVGRVIEPGMCTTYSTTMNMKSGLGPKKEKITFFFDDGTFAVQFYAAEVALPVRVTPPYIAASERQPDQSWVHTMTGELDVTSTDGEPFRIIASHGAEPDLVGWDPAVDPPRTSYTLRWDLTRFDADAIPWFWVIETDRDDCPLVDVRVRHASTLPPEARGRPWAPQDQRILVGEIANDDPFEITTSIEYPRNMAPQAQRAGVISRSERLAAEIVDVEVDDQLLRFRILLTPSDAEPGLFYEQITVYASGGSTQVRIIGRIAG